ncbi:hypothetical protein YYG_03253 [Plasmodium vinckei petteri]|uniref:Fam-c protein n=1 Tax=Plasmodium vinckei petteri TaxID=138298 RepID=W7B227_PLAVN|nr:hypothetical protein YYG_03253 [Plasmodium vinckei petteri]
MMKKYMINLELILIIMPPIQGEASGNPGTTPDIISSESGGETDIQTNINTGLQNANFGSEGSENGKGNSVTNQEGLDETSQNSNEQTKTSQSSQDSFENTNSDKKKNQ